MLEINFLDELIGAEDDIIKVVEVNEDDNYFYFLVEDKNENNKRSNLKLDKKEGMFGVYELTDEENHREALLVPNYFNETVSYCLCGLRCIFPDKEINEDFHETNLDKITLLRNQDNGYGVVSCIQKQDFELDTIHEYFKRNSCYDFDEYNFDYPFKDLDSVISFLNKVEENEEYDFLNELMSGLDETDIWDHFNSTCNPNGCGNQVDELVLTYNGEVLFKF